MRRDFIFLIGGSREIILPIPPTSYRVERGKNVELVNIHKLGDVALPGFGISETVKLDCILPKERGYFSVSGGLEQEEYISVFTKAAQGKESVRFIISGTGVNSLLLLQSFSYGEQDGSNDVYASLTLRGTQTLSTITVAGGGGAVTGSSSRTPPVKATGVQSYTAKYGDTLCSICRKFYGNDKPETYKKLAKYNGKPNPNLLMTGEVLKIPTPLI